MGIVNVRSTGIRWTMPLKGYACKLHGMRPKPAQKLGSYSTVVIETPEGVEVLTRQIAGAVARRIVTYAEVGEECYIDEHMGFIKFGSRVDVYLPIGTEVCVSMGQLTTGNQTVIAKLK